MLRLWLDAALEQFAPSPAPRALPNGLSGEQQSAIKALVVARIEALPEARRGKAATACWSALKSKFSCNYREIAPEQFTEAVSLVARIELDDEYKIASAIALGWIWRSAHGIISNRCSFIPSIIAAFSAFMGTLTRRT